VHAETDMGMGDAKVGTGWSHPSACCTELDANELALAQQVDISDAATAPHHVRRGVIIQMKNCDACALDYMMPSRAADVDLTKDEGAGKGYQRPTQPRQSNKRLRNVKARVPTSNDDDEGNNTDGNQDAHDEVRYGVGETDFTDTVSDSASKKTKRAPPKSTDRNSSPTPEQLQIAELRGMLAQATATAAAKSSPTPERLLIAELKDKLEVAELRGKLAQVTATAAPNSSPKPEQLLIAELKEKLAQATASAEQREILDLKRHNEFLTAQLAAHAAKPDNNVSPQALLQATSDKSTETTKAIAAATQAAHEAAMKQAAAAAEAHQKLAETYAISQLTQAQTALSFSQHSRGLYRAPPRHYSDDDDFEDAKVRSKAPRSSSSSSKRRKRKSSSSSRRRSGESSSDDENPRHPPAIKHIPQPAQPAQQAQRNTQEQMQLQFNTQEQSMAMFKELQRNTQEQTMAMFKELQRTTQEQMLQFKEMMKALLPREQ